MKRVKKTKHKKIVSILDQYMFITTRKSIYIFGDKFFFNERISYEILAKFKESELNIMIDLIKMTYHACRDEERSYPLRNTGVNLLWCLPEWFYG